jgi:hypothetical protein
MDDTKTHYGYTFYTRRKRRYCSSEYGRNKYPVSKIERTSMPSLLSFIRTRGGGYAWDASSYPTSRVPSHAAVGYALFQYPSQSFRLKNWRAVAHWDNSQDRTPGAAPVLPSQTAERTAALIFAWCTSQLRSATKPRSRCIVSTTPSGSTCP